MAKIEELKSLVAEAIERHYVEKQDPKDDENLRCSSIGTECERDLWYRFRWSTPLSRNEGRLQRLFETGHREEDRMLSDLRAIGCEVKERDPQTGKQWAVSFLGGLLQGSADAAILGVPGAEKTWHLGECKTHNDKSFADWRAKGVENAKPVHFIQMQIYMHGLELDRALYVAHNKNTDQVEVERVKYSKAAAEAILAKADRIAHADAPPEKMESFACRWCRNEKICRYEDWARVNCRTCVYAAPVDGKSWTCGRDDHALDYDAQRKGCEHHIYIPDLVPGEIVETTETTVTYQLRVSHEDMAVYVDGQDPKPVVPEVAQ
jgi:hypothetical protein